MALLLSAVSCSYFSKQGEDFANKPSPSAGFIRKSSLTRTLRDVPIFPINSESFRLSDFEKTHKAFVIVTRSLDCPLAPSEKRALSLMENRWSSRPGVKFIYNYVDLRGPTHDGSLSKKQETIKRIEEDIKDLGLKGAYVWDLRLDIAGALMAQTAGDVFVLTPTRQVIYHGPLIAKSCHQKQKNSLRDPAEKNLLQKNPNGKRPICHENQPSHNVVSEDEGLAQGSKPSGRIFPWEGILKNLLSGKSLVPLQWPVVSCPLPFPDFKTAVFFEEAGPVIFKKCTTCHNPKGRGYMDFLSYEDVARRGAMFEYVIENNLMPLWNLAPDTGPWRNDPSLTVREKALLLKWAEGGFRRKDKKRDILRELWQDKQKSLLKEVEDFDFKVHLPEPVQVPSGFRPKMFENYKTFIIPSGFKENRWIKDIKMVLFPKIIHHINFFILDPLLSKKELVRIASDHGATFKNSSAYFINNFVFPHSKNKKDGAFSSAGVLLPVGSHFIMIIHYENPGPAVIDDQTHVKIAFHKSRPDRKIVFYNLDNQAIDIPPYKSLYKTVSSYRLEHDVSLLAFASHMHYRGKATDLFVVSPKGEKQKLFSINSFDVNFPQLYEWQQPISLKKGSVLECVNWFDNSPKNRNNPDPSRRIQFGPGDNSEMSHCYFQFSAPVSAFVENRWIVLHKNLPHSQRDQQ